MLVVSSSSDYKLDSLEEMPYFSMHMFPSSSPDLCASEHVCTRYTAASRQAEARGEDEGVATSGREVSLDISTGRVTRVMAK